jgi:hypothetical protein
MSKLWWQIDKENEEAERKEMAALLIQVGIHFVNISNVRSKRITGSYKIRNGVSIAWTANGLEYGPDGDWVKVTSELPSAQLIDISCHLSHLAAHIQCLKEIDGVALAIKNTEHFLKNPRGVLSPDIAGKRE